MAEDGHSCHCGKFEGKHCEQPACVGGMLNVNGQPMVFILELLSKSFCQFFFFFFGSIQSSY